MSNQPEVLKLAEAMESLKNEVFDFTPVGTELRRLHEVNQDLLEALKEIADWTDRYTTPGHPISVVARKAITKATGE